MFEKTQVLITTWVRFLLFVEQTKSFQLLNFNIVWKNKASHNVQIEFS